MVLEGLSYLLKRRPGRPSNNIERQYANFNYKAKSWSKPRRVVAKVEWHPGELFPRVGFVVTTLTVSDERVFDFYNRRGTAEQYIKDLLRLRPHPSPLMLRHPFAGHALGFGDHGPCGTILAFFNQPY